MDEIVFSPSSIYIQYPIITMQKLLQKKLISHLLKYSDFVGPLAAITAYSLLGYEATSLVHLYLGSFSHSSRQILSSSVRLDGNRHCTAIFWSLQRC